MVGRRVTSIYEPHFDENSVRYAFTYRRARLGHQAGCERLGVSIWELPPGSEGIHHIGDDALRVLGSGVAFWDGE
jgi:uncharacterized cupin superfamily protein